MIVGDWWIVYNVYLECINIYIFIFIFCDYYKFVNIDCFFVDWKGINYLFFGIKFDLWVIIFERFLFICV